VPAYGNNVTQFPKKYNDGKMEKMKTASEIGRTTNGLFSLGKRKKRGRKPSFRRR